MKRILIFNFLIFFTFLLQAQTPAWINFNQRLALFPHDQYYIGFSSCFQENNELSSDLLKRLKKNAAEELGNSVKVTVESISTLDIINTTDDFFQSFKHSSTSFSKIDLAGMETLTYFDKKKKTGYAFTYVKKDDLIDYYHNRLNQIRNIISQKIKAAEQYINQSNEENALKTYYDCMPLFREAESAYTIAFLLQAPEEQIREINQYEIDVKNGIASIYKSEQINLSEVCSFLAFGLKQQTGEFDSLIMLGTFTYEDTKMGSPFSRRFSLAFEKELIEEANYKMTTSIQEPGSKNSSCNYLLSGTYWEDSKNLKIIAILRDMITSKPVASAEAYLPVQWLKERNIFIKPENFEEASESMRVFKKNEIINGGMKLEVWTNKGSVSPIFEENDTLQFYVRTNNECYIRIINHFADGTRVLLVDNLYVGSDKVNKVVKIPGNFLCAPPFGTEVFQVNAQTDYFNPLEVKNENGYDFIEGELDYIVNNTRGFKRLDNEDLKAENRILVTTMSKLEVEK